MTHKRQLLTLGDKGTSAHKELPGNNKTASGLTSVEEARPSFHMSTGSKGGNDSGRKKAVVEWNPTSP